MSEVIKIERDRAVELLREAAHAPFGVQLVPTFQVPGVLVGSVQ